MLAEVGQFLEAHWKDGVEIFTIAVLFYGSFRYLRRLRGARILVQLVIILVALSLLSGMLNLQVLSWLIRSISLFAIIGLIVIFQPELRRAAVELERFSLFRRRKEREDFAERMWEICRQLSAKRFGALMALERSMELDEFSETGVSIDSQISSELLMTIFHPKTVLHDGGVVLKNGRIEAAGCVFPVSQRELLDRSIGLRHRAALGLSEQTDAIVMVVSEETGNLTLAHNGELERNLEPEDFVSRLQELLAGEPEPESETPAPKQA